MVRHGTPPEGVCKPPQAIGALEASAVNDFRARCRAQFERSLPATDIGQGAWADQAQASFARACRLAALVAWSAGSCARVRRTRLCGARGLLSAGTLKRGKRAICLASTGTLRLPYRAPVPLLLSWPHM